MTLNVAASLPTVSIGFEQIAWDPINGNNRPKAIPGSKRRIVLTVTNPDIVATDLNALQVLLPTPAKMAVALDGDGSGSGATMQFTEGNTASGLTIGYTGPSSSTDQIDFSADGGTSWNYSPIAGNPASEGGVTTVRFRPQGTMAPKSSFSASVPYRIK